MKEIKAPKKACDNLAKKFVDKYYQDEYEIIKPKRLSKKDKKKMEEFKKYLDTIRG